MFGLMSSTLNVNMMIQKRQYHTSFFQWKRKSTTGLVEVLTMSNLCLVPRRVHLKLLQVIHGCFKYQPDGAIQVRFEIQAHEYCSTTYSWVSGFTLYMPLLKGKYHTICLQLGANQHTIQSLRTPGLCTVLQPATPCMVSFIQINLVLNVLQEILKASAMSFYKNMMPTLEELHTYLPEYAFSTLVNTDAADSI
jgi:hypothetical protein